MQIDHRPRVNVAAAEAFYTKKDGVPVKYVCSSAKGQGVISYDIFYRATPHPDFGNKYFGLTKTESGAMIGNTDWIESEVFDCIDGPDGLVYSRHRHDYVKVGKDSIDGGRAYTRRGSPDIQAQRVTRFVVRNGECVRDDRTS